MTSFDQILPRLIAAYECGRLVPFIGSGMSMPAAVSWADLVSKLEKNARIGSPAKVDDCKMREDYIRRANAAVRTLKSLGSRAFLGAIKDATLNPTLEEQSLIPRKTDVLASMDWPLVLTTNYDNIYEAAFARNHEQRSEYAPTYSVVGRQPEDCQRVLNSLSVAGRALIWALQGYFDEPHPTPRVKELRAKAWRAKNTCLKDPLHEQIVIGHEQYRRVTHRETHFRRAFAEVFRQRSLLFLGSGVAEPYLHELFGEVLEIFGPSTRPHYAIMSEGAVDPEFMLSRFQITVATYPRGQHEKVTSYLEVLQDEVSRRSTKEIGWTWTAPAPMKIDSEDGELEVVRRPLFRSRPGQRDDKHCLVVSAAGWSGQRFYVSEELAEILTSWGIEVEEDIKEQLQKLPLYRYIDSAGYREVTSDLVVNPESHVYVVKPHSETDRGQLARVYGTSAALFEDAGRRSYSCIHTQLLAARVFPARFSFAQMVRAYAEWRRGPRRAACKLVIYVADPSVSGELGRIDRELATGRIDVIELLTCPDLRFWVEVVLNSGEFERRLFQSTPQTDLRRIAGQMNLSPDGKPPTNWEFEVTPPPQLGANRRKPVKCSWTMSLQDIGVVPGSTVHFRQLDDPAPPGEAA